MRFLITGLIFLMLLSPLSAAHFNMEINLRGRWYFEIGDNPKYADQNFDESNWVKVWVPEKWEDEGFPGYDGFAWYRVHVNIPEHLKEKSLFLKLGKIDDRDETYLNGKSIGKTGTFDGTDGSSAYNQERCYSLPKSLIKFGEENVIAVKVLDNRSQGGIYSGPIGIYSKETVPLLVEFDNEWKFSPGDDPDWAEPDYDDTEWNQIQSQSAWENQGYPYLDGFAWYRKTVDVPQNLSDSYLILALGMIDDRDQVYFNGKRIGGTGHIDKNENDWGQSSWKKERFYYIPKNLIHLGEENVIAVRVLDKRGRGGMYEDPAGITNQQSYLKYRRNKRSTGLKIERMLEFLFESIFD